MSSYTISKSFTAEYSHRVHCQIINSDYTERGHTQPKCRHIHGHSGHFLIELISESLNPQDMVVDLVWLGWFKNFIDDNIDHKFILDINDPIFSLLTNGKTIKTSGEFPFNFIRIDKEESYNIKNVFVPGTDKVAGMVLDLHDLPEGPEKEYFESFFFVNFVPSSENLSKFLFELVDAKMSLIGVKTNRVEFKETPKSCATYTG